MEQYLALQKARLFGDHKTAAVIQQQEDPVQIKKIAKKVSGFKKEIWEQKIENILTTGLTAKFNQNRNLAEFLRNTGKNIFSLRLIRMTLCVPLGNHYLTLICGIHMHGRDTT